MPSDTKTLFAFKDRPCWRIETGVPWQRSVVEIDRTGARPLPYCVGKHSQIGNAEQPVELELCRGFLKRVAPLGRLNTMRCRPIPNCRVGGYDRNDAVTAIFQVFATLN
ncbi:hypothetical protein LAX5112_04706 [Roseibium alexandrii]|uniref:Uncharacterized protein n=1 Tax=Roseibium alexandrii TaxID=388408 RepID=A0A0M7AQU2_9HYPH|nr:hypothetical protein LAX5112_04706 [Roseibium alexandrii]